MCSRCGHRAGEGQRDSSLTLTYALTPPPARFLSDMPPRRRRPRPALAVVPAGAGAGVPSSHRPSDRPLTRLDHMLRAGLREREAPKKITASPAAPIAAVPPLPPRPEPREPREGSAPGGPEGAEQALQISESWVDDAGGRQRGDATVRAAEHTVPEADPFLPKVIIAPDHPALPGAESAPGLDCLSGALSGSPANDGKISDPSLRVVSSAEPYVAARRPGTPSLRLVVNRGSGPREAPLPPSEPASPGPAWPTPLPAAAPPLPAAAPPLPAAAPPPALVSGCALLIALTLAGGYFAWWPTWQGGPPSPRARLVAPPAPLMAALAAPPAPAASAREQEAAPAAPRPRQLPAGDTERPSAGAGPPGLKAQLLHARQLLQGGRLKEAQRAYERLLEHNPDSAEVHAGLGSCASRGERHLAALSHYKAALLLSPEYPAALLGLADTYRRRGDQKLALEFYERYQRAPGKVETKAARRSIARLETYLRASSDAKPEGSTDRQQGAGAAEGAAGAEARDAAQGTAPRPAP